MKKAVYLILVFTLFTAVIFSCKKENNDNNQLVFSGKLTNSPTCKERTKYASRASDNNTLSCVKYTFDKPNNTLILRHINAGFNCCPGKLYIKTSLSGNTITIKEYESEASCECQCLYDLDITLTGVEAKKYKIEFVEPYATGQQQIVFEVDLGNNNEDSFCVTRKKYPWGS